MKNSPLIELIKLFLKASPKDYIESGLFLTMLSLDITLQILDRLSKRVFGL